MMLAAIGIREILRSKEYIFEPKLDGYRALCEKKRERYDSYHGTTGTLPLSFPNSRLAILLRPTAHSMARS